MYGVRLALAQLSNTTLPLRYTTLRYTTLRYTTLRYTNPVKRCLFLVGMKNISGPAANGTQIKGKTHIRSFFRFHIQYIHILPFFQTLFPHRVLWWWWRRALCNIHNLHRCSVQVNIWWLWNSVWFSYSNVFVSAYVSPFIYSGFSLFFSLQSIHFPVRMIGTHCCVNEPWSHKINKQEPAVSMNDMTVSTRLQCEAALNIASTSLQHRLTDFIPCRVVSLPREEIL